MAGTNLDTRNLPPFEKAVIELLQQILSRLATIERQIPNLREFPDTPDRE
jgi:hypothetical protein